MEILVAYLRREIREGVLDLGVVERVKAGTGDSFYTVTPKACSCTAQSTWRPGKPCKHQRKHFPQPKEEASTSSIKPSGGWIGGHNGPVLE